jgi:hypothetical protein
LEVLAHITAPKWKNWWAERSAAATRKRIEKLEKQLADYGKNAISSATEDIILKGIEATGQLAVLCVQLLVIILLLVVLYSGPKNTSVRELSPILALAILAAGAGYFVGFVILKKVGTFRMERSASKRDALRKSIEELKLRLAQRTKS